MEKNKKQITIFSEVVTKCNQLKMQATDGKLYLTDVADTEAMFSFECQDC